MIKMTKCPPGEITRKGYSFTNKKGTHVKVGETCVPDKGKPGKTPKSEKVLPKLKKGRLGWKKDMSETKRRELLVKKVGSYGYAKVIAMLNAVINYTTDTATKRKMKSDRSWLQRKFRPDKYEAGYEKKDIVPAAVIIVAGLLIFMYFKNRYKKKKEAYSACPKHL